MLALGLVLVALGTLAVLAAIFLSEGGAVLVGLELPVLAIVLVGVVTGVFLVVGTLLTKRGTKREWRVRRDRQQLRRYQEQEHRPSDPTPSDGGSTRRSDTTPDKDA